MRSLFFPLMVLGTVGCSVDVGNLFGNGGAGGDGAGGAGAQQTSNVATDASTTTDGATTTTTTDGATSVTTGGQTSATSTTTGGNTATSTGSGMPTGVKLFCNGGECGPNQVCCFNRFSAGMDFCAAPGGCPDGGDWTTLECNDAADCGTGECCGTYDPQQGWVKVECSPQCNSNELVMCFGDPGACAPNQTCNQSQSLGNGYKYCAGG